MSQHDLNIANQSFPSFRTDLNNALSAIQTTHSGTSLPTGAVAGQIWLDTTSATVPILKYYDGADNITLATINHTANTVDFADSSVVVTGLSSTATGTVLTLTDTVSTSTVNLIIDNQKEIRFRETTANGTNYVALKAPASLASDTTFILPSADGTNGQALITNGSGTLSFSTISTSLATPLVVVGDATAGASIRLPEDTDNGSNFVALKAPDTIASNLTLTLPSADGTSGQVLQTNGSGVLSFSTISGSVFGTALLHVRDEKSSGTGGGTFNSGSFQTRTLNTVMTNEISGASLASNQITLPSGTYFIQALCPAENVDGHKAKLRNITDSTDTIIGRTARASSSGVNSTYSDVIGRFTISAQKTFELQHRAETSYGAGFGNPSSFSLTEIYAIAMIWKIA